MRREWEHKEPLEGRLQTSALGLDRILTFTQDTVSFLFLLLNTCLRQFEKASNSCVTAAQQSVA